MPRVIAFFLTVSLIVLVIFMIKSYKDDFSKAKTDSSVKNGTLSNASEIVPVQDKRKSTEWYLQLVNKNHPIDENFKIDLVKLSNGEKVDKRIYDQLQEMFDAARKNGIYPVVASGYRTEKEQTQFYNDKIKEYKKLGATDEEAKTEAEYWVAIPGTSEHQSGLAVDINGDKKHSENADVYKWLENNAYKYGFVYRYQADKFNLTGVANEQWHYRYVGKEAAKEMYNENLCLEEYLGETNREIINE